MIDYRYGFDRQSYEFWRVGRDTWADSEMMGNVSSFSLLRDLSTQTLESASGTFAGEGFGEAWVRAYMSVWQAGEHARIPLGTWLAQKSERGTDGAAETTAVTLYSPLVVLANRDRTGNRPPVGFTVPVGVNCAAFCRQLMEAHGLAPVTATLSTAALDVPLVAGPADSWLDVCGRLAKAAGCEIRLDAMGRVLIAPIQARPQPTWTFEEGDGSRVISTLGQSATEKLDTFDVPNAVEVVWTNGRATVVGRAEELDGRSTSMAGRGYEQVLRIENPPELQAGCTESRANMLAEEVLAREARITRTIEIEHAFCPVRAGDTVAVEYGSAGIRGVGKVVRQSMDLVVGAVCSSVVEVVEEVL